jgi:hypothetical protein
VPDLKLDTEAERRHFAAAEIRKKLRQDSLEKIRALHNDVNEQDL